MSNTRAEIDLVRVQVGSTDGSWSAEIDLARAALRRADEPDVSIPDLLLQKLAAEAEAAHRLGDHCVREQFADGTVLIDIFLRGSAVRCRFDLASHDRVGRLQGLYDVARGGIPEPPVG